MPARFSYFDFMDKVVYDTTRDLKSYYTLLRGSLAISFIILYLISFTDKHQKMEN